MGLMKGILRGHMNEVHPLDDFTEPKRPQKHKHYDDNFLLKQKIPKDQLISPPHQQALGSMQPFQFEQESSDHEYGYDEKISHDKTQDIDLHNRSDMERESEEQVDHFNEDIISDLDLRNMARQAKPAALRVSNSDVNMGHSPAAQAKEQKRLETQHDEISHFDDKFPEI